MQGVPGTTSSRVPGTLPGRPRPGCRRSLSTVLLIVATTRAAANGLSRAMYSASASRLAKAERSHLTRTPRPFSQSSPDLRLAGKFAVVGFHNGFLRLVDLPMIQCDVLAYRFGRDERAAATSRFR